MGLSLRNIMIVIGHRQGTSHRISISSDRNESNRYSSD